MRLPICLLVLTVASLAITHISFAELPGSPDAPAAIEFFAVDVEPLVAGFDKSHIVSDPPVIEASFYQMDTAAHILVPAGVEAYLWEPENTNDAYRGYRIVGSKMRGEAIDGQLFMLRRHPERPRESVLARFDFGVPADHPVPASREDYLRARGRYAQRMWSEEMAGSALFRHIAISSLKEVGESAQSTGPNWPLRRREGVDETIKLMSGGRAVSENLQLDAQLDQASGDGELVSLSEVAGIQVREINWSGLLQDKPTELDPLANRIPHNQYAVFVPTFKALLRIIDRGGELAKPITQWFEPQSRKTDVIGFYQQQLGLPVNALTRQVGQALIDEVAVTGSDPYFRTGTDVAVLMRSTQPQLLHQSIIAQVTAQAALHRDVRQIEHKVGNRTFTQWSTEDRQLSSFVALVDDAVVVSNSLQQMLQIFRCGDGEFSAMHNLDEYRFFRQRYSRNSVNEAALIVVTDAAIRRWCGPQWRISASRRTRARATIADVTAQNADSLVAGTVTGTTAIHTSGDMPEAGSLMLTSGGVLSRTLGTLDFQTPIAEIDLKQATGGEVEMYTRWRERYERQWSRVFDPIALHLSMDENSTSADLSVIPLVVQTRYQLFQQLVGQVRLRPDAGDPHAESLASFTMALDTDSQLFQFARMWLTNSGAGVGEIDLMAWIDGSFSIYLDYDKEWMERFNKRSPWQFDVRDMQRDIPVGFFVPSKDSLRMTAFVVALRSMIGSISPNMIRWDTAKHHDFEYVVGTFLQRTIAGDAEEMPQMYYVTTPVGLTISANRGVIERVIDRQLAVEKSAPAVDAEQESVPAGEPGPGPQLVMEGNGAGANVMARSNYQGLRRMHRISWSNIPILNHFRIQYPDRDPFEVYQQLFGETLVEPSGGSYQWNADRGTYVSTLHGYHLEPKAGPAIAPALGMDDELQATLSFQDGGIRATMTIQQNQSADVVATP